MKRLALIVFIALFLFFPKSSFAQIYTTDKLITIDTTSQTLNAWEGGHIINSSRVSTGMYYTPTIKGVFRIYKKYNIQDMKGRYPPYEPYSLKNVPNVMYFYQAYAIHGAYWHNAFGYKYSHGCVNEPVAFSKWLYDWASIGTQVYVY